MLNRFQSVLIAGLTVWFVDASAQVFECVDASGKREYTQKCRPGTVSEREVWKSEPNRALPPQQQPNLDRSVPSQNSPPPRGPEPATISGPTKGRDRD